VKKDPNPIELPKIDLTIPTIPQIQIQEKEPLLDNKLIGMEKMLSGEMTVQSEVV
jgi:hypothetical protein